MPAAMPTVGDMGGGTFMRRRGPDAPQLWELWLLGVVEHGTSKWSLLWPFDSHKAYKSLKNMHFIQL